MFRILVFLCVKLITTPHPRWPGGRSFWRYLRIDFCAPLTCDLLLHGSALWYCGLGGWVNVVCGEDRLLGPLLRLNSLLWATATILPPAEISTKTLRRTSFCCNQQVGLSPATSTRYARFIVKSTLGLCFSAKRRDATQPGLPLAAVACNSPLMLRFCSVLMCTVLDF